MLAHDSIADAQAQPGSLPNFLGGKKWIKDALRMLNAFAIIAEKDFDPAAILNGFNLDQAWSTRGLHGIIRVVQDIEKYLLQLMRITDQIRQARIKFLYDLHAMIGEVIRAQRDCLAQNVIDLQRLALRRTLASKAQQVLHN